MLVFFQVGPAVPWWTNRSVHQIETFGAPLVLNRLLGRLINLPLSLVRSLKRRLIKRRLISILDGMHRSVPGAPERLRECKSRSRPVG